MRCTFFLMCIKALKDMCPMKKRISSQLTLIVTSLTTDELRSNWQKISIFVRHPLELMFLNSSYIFTSN